MICGCDVTDVTDVTDNRRSWSESRDNTLARFLLMDLYNKNSSRWITLSLLSFLIKLSSLSGVSGVINTWGAFSWDTLDWTFLSGDGTWFTLLRRFSARSTTHALDCRLLPGLGRYWTEGDRLCGLWRYWTEGDRLFGLGRTWTEEERFRS